ncbi:MAG: PadR family transcriptional regulator [Gemmatimonadota bacterium]
MSVEDHLPLKPVLFWILLVLVDGSSHGYRILKEIESRTDGRIRLEPGNLYRYLRKLLDAGLIEEVVAADLGEGTDPRRRSYAVSPLGRRVVAAEARRMHALVQAAEARMPLELEGEG